MRLGWVACAFGIAAWLGGATEARACSCIEGWSVLAPFGDEHPSGAPIVFASSCGGSFEPWSVTVDGAPASIATPVIVGEIATGAIMPAPAEGAEVVLSFDCSLASADDACAGNTATIERARFTIGPADMIGPPPAVALTMDPREEVDDDCFASAGMQAFDVTIDFGDREPGTWIALDLERGGAPPLASTRLPVPQEGSASTVLLVDEDVLDFPEICLHGVVHDASGNVTLNTEDASNIFPATVEDCIFAENPGIGQVGPLRRCAVAPTTEWSSAFVGLLVLMLRRRAFTDTRA